MPLWPSPPRSRGAACPQRRPAGLGKAWPARSPSASRSSQTGLQLITRAVIQLKRVDRIERVVATTTTINHPHLWCLALWAGCSKTYALPPKAALHAPLPGTAAGSTFGCFVWRSETDARKEPMRRRDVRDEVKWREFVWRSEQKLKFLDSKIVMVHQRNKSNLIEKVVFRYKSHWFVNETKSAWMVGYISR